MYMKFGAVWAFALLSIQCVISAPLPHRSRGRTIEPRDTQATLEVAIRRTGAGADTPGGKARRKDNTHISLAFYNPDTFGDAMARDKTVFEIALSTRRGGSRFAFSQSINSARMSEAQRLAFAPINNKGLDNQATITAIGELVKQIPIKGPGPKTSGDWENCVGWTVRAIQALKEAGYIDEEGYGKLAKVLSKEFQEEISALRDHEIMAACRAVRTGVTSSVVLPRDLPDCPAQVGKAESLAVDKGQKSRAAPHVRKSPPLVGRK